MQLSGLNQSPKVVSTGTGNGIVTINRDHNSAHIMAAYANLSGPATGIHFHLGVAGSNGGVLRDLMANHTANGNSGIVAFYWNSKSSPAFSMSDAIKFDKDSVYINVHTSIHPNGELRSQANRDFSAAEFAASITSIQTQKIKLYPNPANQILNIDMANDQISAVQILDGTGRLVLSSNDKTISISDLNNGIYTVIIKTEKPYLVTISLKFKGEVLFCYLQMPALGLAFVIYPPHTALKTHTKPLLWPSPRVFCAEISNCFLCLDHA
ncbi:MAG: CHRD domain-containing protein [Bacteroidetes bacterium]|nr:CHRD domain-containing protein [Bacteroidota bacterium]